MPDPLYRATDLHPAYQLRYGCFVWPSVRFPQPPGPDIQKQLALEWETDGIRVLESTWSHDAIQFTVSTKPDVTPVLLVSRIKGRLGYHWRAATSEPVQFSRKLAL